MRDEVEETREQILAWVEAEERVRAGNGDSPFGHFKEKVRTSVNLRALMNLEVEFWRELGYEEFARDCLRTAGELISADRGQGLCADAAKKLLEFVSAFTIMPSTKRPGLWALMKKVEEGLKLLGFGPEVIAQAEYIVEVLLREDRLNHVLVAQ